MLGEIAARRFRRLTSTPRVGRKDSTPTHVGVTRPRKV
jgi:hypothetical protein